MSEARSLGQAGEPGQPAPLIELAGIRKRYGGHDGAPAVEVLRGLTLSIGAGEFVAIVGASGSGKSTLMHLLGCLDRPSDGTYRFAGQDVASLNPDELAWLRREAFGFVFQGYHLIATESARENVEVPALYAGMPAAARHARSAALLKRLGLGERLDHRPNQLSGGQQQRVSIARALMNGGRIILADEPTGALDSSSGAEVMALLGELADAGHTIILITHDRKVAAQARRVIEISDGEIVADSGAIAIPATSTALPPLDMSRAAHDTGASLGTELLDAARAAWRVLWINRFRTGLTLLGIVIGVASVIVMLAIGLGTRQQVMAQLGAFGSNLLYMASRGESSRIPGRSITLADLDALKDVPGISHVLPNVTGNKVIRHGNLDVQTYVRGTGPALPQIQTWPVAKGGFFTEEDEREMATVAVLGAHLAEKLMPDVPNPVGQSILIGNVPFQVIGVMSAKGALTGEKDEDDVLLLPFSTAGIRVFGQREPTYTVMAVDDVKRVTEVEAAVDATMFERHRIRDYGISNAAASIAAEAKTQDNMTMMLSLIAAVSLVVGGIGVMNVMLMTVRERTREIGIRMATGARRRDILRQFLTEAVLVSVVGGVAGIVVGVTVAGLLLVWDVPVIFSLSAIAGAFACAVVTGLVFGFMPARKASGLDPVVALAGQ
ncbi:MULTISPECIES: MacB family efflux pump subunit [unclassified Janthinobacterium]|uniref:MacB family efflux pump subunit n=1 Tax=unclassified Janthinobacterium TaxID=2610881 RepID=UPI001E3B8822|nr:MULTISPECIES: MacB family efflux pump subunit [unclassified Janthinobacterium]MCC7645744.1 MacB family efflux pump subunit [Janthinobacterium sp. EB271-G4-3-1]MCC7694499.1 MacB family efflux pump subunit [Janthinobacterium sp. EB271-G4-3-2]